MARTQVRLNTQAKNSSLELAQVKDFSIVISDDRATLDVFGGKLHIGEVTWDIPDIIGEPSSGFTPGDTIYYYVNPTYTPPSVLPKIEWDFNEPQFGMFVIGSVTIDAGTLFDVFTEKRSLFTFFSIGNGLIYGDGIGQGDTGKLLLDMPWVRTDVLSYLLFFPGRSQDSGGVDDFTTEFVFMLGQGQTLIADAVYLNGVRQDPALDYTVAMINPGEIHVYFTNPPLTGDKILADFTLLAYVV